MKISRIKFLFLLLLTGTVCSLGIFLLFWKPLVSGKDLPTDETCRALLKKYDLSFSPEAVRAGAVSLMNPQKTWEQALPGIRTPPVRFSLPEGWKFYLPSNWKRPGLLSISVQGGKWRMISGDSVSFMSSDGCRKPALSLIRIRARGFGKIIPLMRTYHYFYLNEKEYRLPKERIRSLFFKDYYFIAESRDDSNTAAFGLSVSGWIDVSEIWFYPVDDQRLKGTTLLEGTVTAASPCPDPSRSDYPNCFYSVELEGKLILKGPPVPRRILLLPPAFADFKPAPTANLKAGDRIRVSVLPFQEGSEKERSTQLSDTLDLFDLERFLVRKLEKIRDFQPQNEISKIYFAEPGEYVSPYGHPQNPPVSPAAEIARKKEMADDLASLTERIGRIKGREKTINDAFSKVWDVRQKECKKLDGDFFWGRVGESCFVLPRRHEFLRHLSIVSNLEAIRELDRYLKAQGVQFMVVVIPDFRDVAARALNPEFAQYIDPASGETVRTLLENDIEALYVMDALLEQASRYPFLFAYPHDPHPVQGAQEVIADRIAKRLEKRFPGEWTPRCAASDFSMEDGLSATRSVIPAGVDAGTLKPGSPLPCRIVKYKGKPYRENPSDSKLLVLGNSFIQTPFPGFKSLAGLLAVRMLYLPQEFSVHAHGPAYTIPLELFNHPDLYLKNKKVCVLSIYEGHLADYNFVNLKQIDQEKKLLSGKQKAGFLPLPVVPPPEFTGSQRDFLGQWKAALQDASGAMEISLPNAEQWYELPEIPVPEKYGKNGETVLQLELQPYLNAQYTLRINGQSFSLPIAEELLPVRLVYRNPSSSRSLKMEVKSNAPGGIFAVKRITVYR